MFAGNQGQVEAWAMLGEGVKLSSLQIVPHSWNLDDLAKGRVDALSAYLTDEPYTLRRKGVDLVAIRPLEVRRQAFMETSSSPPSTPGRIRTDRGLPPRILHGVGLRDRPSGGADRPRS